MQASATLSTLFWNKMKKEPKLSSLIDKAVFDYKLIQHGDRILVGASGGKDSTALIEYLANRKMRPENASGDFEYKALFIKSDFAPDFPQNLRQLFKEWNVPFEQLDVNILERVKQGEKMNCWWCSTQRRTELLNYAIKNGYNKIALGHHKDDILETLLMNLLNKGEFSAMSPAFKYDKYPVTIIRPLCYVSEDRIIAHAKEEGFAGFTCTCNYQDNSDRKLARLKLEALTDGEQSKKDLLFRALCSTFTLC